MRVLTAAVSYLFIVLFFLVSCSANATAPINVDSNGFAVKGYDTVAYFTDGKPLPGKKEFQYEWKNAKWLFTSEEHLKLFQDNPEKYIPQYGGY